MKRRMLGVLAATVALPMLATPALAQQDRGYSYGPSDHADYHWSERQNAIERDRLRTGDYVGQGMPPNPPRTPDRYITDWDQTGQGRDWPEPPYTPDRYITDWDDYRRGGGPNPPYTPERYVTDWDRGGGYGSRPYADDRWSGRDAPTRDFDRPSPPPGYHGEPGFAYEGYGRGSYERGFDPYSPYAEMDERERHHRAMMERHRQMMRARQRGGGYEDRDFRRDFAEDGRRGYYQDSSYEGMPRGRQRMGGGRDRMGDVDMRQIRRAMRMIDRFDIDKDGRVTQREVDRYRSDRLRQFDTDSDDQLTLDEYAALWADAMRERMVRRFQRHDRDGDARVSLDEFSAATRDLVPMRDRNRDQAISEDDFMRPEVAAPLGGSPNEPAQSRVAGDDDVADDEVRPEVEAPIDATPDEPAGAAATENGDSGADEDALETDTD